MRFVYAVINLLILAGLIYLVGRKSIVKIFRSRREKIARELDEAETPFAPEPLPEMPAPDDTALKSELAAAEKDGKAALAELDAQYEADAADQRREMLFTTRAQIIEQVLSLAEQHMRSAEYQASKLARQNEAVEQILAQIHLTPGDVSYISRKGVLYVTLTSAAVLPDETVEKVRKRAEALVAAAGGKISYWVRQKEELIGGLQLRIGDTIYDYTISNKLYRLGKALNDRPLTETDADSIRAGMLDAVRHMKLGIDVFQVGRVLSVSDGICWMDGLADIMYGELVEFVNGERGMVMDIQADRVGCIIFGRYDHVDSYSRVRRLNKMASVPVGEAMLGRVVDALGKPIDGRGRIWSTETRPIEFQAPAIPDRQSVSVPLHTGIKAIDALVPIGRGQRELIIGDRKTGKTAIAIDAILNQRGKGMVCIYVAIGQKASTVANIRETLAQHGALDYTIIVSATAADSAPMQYIAPMAGAAIGEFFMYNGEDGKPASETNPGGHVLVIYDDLSKQAVAYRQMSLTLHRPPGREAYPGDIFYLHSRLLERAVKMSKKNGYGSMTALPIIETQDGDVSAYIPTNVISITDGQIYLQSELFFQGQRPAVDVGISVSRVGGDAQTKAMKQVAGNLRLDLASYQELAGFTQFGSDLDEATQKQLTHGARMTELLKQPRYKPFEVGEQIVTLFAGNEGFLDDLEIADVLPFRAELIEYMDNGFGSLLDKVRAKKIDDDTKAELLRVIGDFKQQFMAKHHSDVSGSEEN